MDSSWLIILYFLDASYTQSDPSIPHTHPAPHLEKL